MSKIIKQIKSKWHLYIELLFTVAAFFLMVALSYGFIRGIIKDHLIKITENVLAFEIANIEAFLIEPKAKLDIFSETVHGMLESGSSKEELQNYINSLSNSVRSSKETVSGYGGFYGYFETLAGGPVFLNGENWIPPPTYFPKERPWYKIAVEANGATVESQPYVDAITGNVVFTYSCSINDSLGKSIGVIGIDVYIDAIGDHVVEIALANNSFGLLLNKDLVTFAHPSDNYKNKHISQLPPTVAALENDLRNGENVSLRHVLGYTGEKSLAFFRKISNGWYLGIITPEKPYYASISYVLWVLSGFGVVLAFILCYVQIRMYKAKNMADLESKHKSMFLAKMSHEIRTPMNAIVGMAELALREKLSPRVYEQVTTVKQAGDGLLSIINDILDFSKIESGKLEIHRSDYLFSSLINDVISIIRMRVVNTEIKFVVNIDSNLPNALFSDEVRIRQILLNILNNAVKFTKEGYVSLVVTGEEIDEDNIKLVIEVADSGIGIKEENIDKLFKDFSQVGLSDHKGIEGTGLGLSITKNLVNAMGGDITVSSEYGVGSTFTITLPQKVRNHEKLALVETPDKKRAIIYEKRNIYADSVVYTINNLGVSSTLVSTDTELYEELVNNQYDFAFVAASLFENVSNICSKSDIKVILLAEFGEVTANENLSILSMPAHSISVANILNGTNDNYFYNESGALNIKFTAHNANVLVVDDVNTNLNVAAGLLSPYEMNVDCCTSGIKAIEAVISKQYDLIFMDHMMPEMDGIEAVSKIRALNDGNSYHKSVPIIALTANAVSGTKEMFLEKGFNDFLSKPIDTVKMNTILEKWIPKEKQDKANAPKIETLQTPKSSLKLNIEGLDINKGLAMSGGKVENYKKTLSIFMRDCREKIKEIEKCLETDNLPLYTTYVHALKSASANVGATGLSEMAAALEKAGKQEDLAFIQNHNAKLILSLSTLIDNISGELKTDNPKKAVDKTLLESEFAKLAGAIESMDLRAIKAAIKAIQPLTDGTDTVVEDILQNAKIGEYEKALSSIKRKEIK